MKIDWCSWFGIVRIVAGGTTHLALADNETFAAVHLLDMPGEGTMFASLCGIEKS